MKSVEISSRNSEFWNELCGTSLAKYLGIDDASMASLKRFDDWYFNFYPYLFDHIPFAAMKGKNVLEIGLGYGTVSQCLAASGAHYTGLDIAPGPVEMVNHRIQQAGLIGQAMQGSILEPSFADDSFDYIVAIGCLHHTGDLQLAVENCRRLLRPGGKLIFMVYYAYSYRRYRIAFWTTLKTLLKEAIGHRGVVGTSSERERAAYDSSSNGACAPHTDWISKRSLKKYCSKYNLFSVTLENIDKDSPFMLWSREQLINTKLPKYCGLDIYATATK